MENLTDYNSFWTERLSGRISKYEAIKYAQMLHNDEDSIDHLCKLVCGNKSERVSMNGAWVLSHIGRQDAETYMPKYRDMFIDFVMSSDIKIRRGLILAILLNMPDQEEPRTDFLDYCMNEFLNSGQSDSSRSSMIKVAARICNTYPELTSELHERLSILPTGVSPCIANVKQKVLSGKKV